MLQITDLSARVAGRLLIDHASLSIPAGTKAGLVGRNGAGKSTLFRVITGDLASESGGVSIPRNTRIGQVAQEAPGTEQSLLEVVLAADLERVALLEEAETATDPQRISEVHLRLADIESHSAEARAAAILDGLGFDAVAQARPVSSFSGGWRMRVALAAVLFSRPDLLLLDEPTNYLDLEGTLWLENFVSRYPYTVLIISHDRDVLNNAVNAIIHLDQKKLVFYRGDYDSFERQRTEKLELLGKAIAKQDAARKHMEAFVERFRAKASKARQAQSRLKALERMKPLQAIVEEHVTPFVFPKPEKILASPIIRMEGVSVGYSAERSILRGLDIRIDADDRIALLGANGNGKSTFAKLIAERLTAQRGSVTRAPGLKIAMFAQHQIDDLRPNETAVQHVRRFMPDAPEAKVRGRVAQMGLPTQKMDTVADSLSGGEKARLLMGLATIDAPNLLILDEPTNHLDIEARESLVHALNDFPGAVILISHDRHMVEATMDRLWIVGDGTVKRYDGDLDDYKKLILSGARSGGGNQGEAIEEATVPVVSKVDQRRLAAEKREALKPLKKKITNLEVQMSRLQATIKDLDEKLADPALYTRDPAKAADLGRQKSSAEKTLERCEAEWLEFTEEHDSAMAD
ncbi:ABC-F family ATP-binding cassette domain-containing protein [Aureimonas phyllosphaerae]|uniref:ATP-binding cassette subfamily F protein 3 n=1 Tax=Aureimonas phyllosphaerae TaxID=1166078 RepID=A0A7W6BYJ7_9HYPH|nr:ABC-F family ATP-binding cassette domain-containing protein [Aureimonas phyllosphaerae]MBB3935142.1 ATP-binding cassette subfamily F protein 3 [Aureimonas phyllosphaerae]MBB3959150.1 ATP-binding cassette subfamily F protein 3 [Aureimonas phyllosphaerae]SFF07334.1 ATP-binding cassette, subfamily F, member 3 [Aureimonas phyllosphaerae]